MQRHTSSRTAMLTVCIAVLLATGALAQTATFTTTSSPSGIYQARTVTSDVNNDGREDFVSTQQVNSPLPGFTVQLSNGDGTYAPPVSYQLPNSGDGIAYDVVVADVNGDGKLDIIVTHQADGFYEYLNNGDGTFHLQAHFVVPMARVMTVGDFNHDGKPDLAFECSPDLSSTNICVWFGNGDNGFDAGPTTNIASVFLGSDLLMGDFDGDGKADLAVIGAPGRSQTTTAFLFGDNTGHFQVSPLNTDLAQVAFRAADLNGDGKSDLVGSPMNFADGSPTNQLIVYYGNSARTADHLGIPLSSCSTGYKPAIADLNGDGIPDLALTEYATCTQVPYNLVVKLGNGDGTFSSESVLYSSSGIFSEVYALRANQDTKPDLAVIHYTAANPQTEILDFLNTSTGGRFPSCTAPVDSYFGINICSPGSSTTTTAVHFGIGAAGQTPMRKVEVWVDGTKQAEQFAHAFSHYAFLDSDTTLSAGTHTVDVYAAGWDNLLQHTSFTVDVAGSGGGGGGCGQPTVPGVSICSPINGANEPSTFTISAAGRNSGPTAGMDVWLDGQKVGWFDGATSVNIQATAGAGTHQLDVYAIGVNGEKQQATSVFNVSGGGGGSCTTPSSPGVNICTPANGSTVSSPVTISASGRNTGTTAGMDVWLDGNKVGWYGGTTTVNIQVSASAGSHQLDIYAVGTDGELQQATSIFTVSGGGGGGGGCPVPTSGVNVCAPTEGSTVNTPVRIWASGSGNGLDVWVDGQKVGWYDAQTVDVNVDLALGAHVLEIFPTPYSGTGKATVHFTVGGTGGSGGPYTGPCDMPSDANTLNVCSPVSGSTVPSPVRVAVHGGANVTTIEMWYDGVKTLMVSGGGGQYIDIPYGMPSGVHHIDFYGKASGAVVDHKYTQFTVTNSSSGDVQYAVPLHTLSAGPGAGQVSVTTGGDVTASVSGWTAGTYGVKFCMYPASVYPDSSCINLGALNIDASGNGSTSVHFPQTGTWAGLFRIYDTAGNRVLESSGSLNSDGSGYQETYSAKIMTWMPSSTTNTAGAESNGPQDPGSGTINVEYANVVAKLSGAAPNTTYDVIQCYMGGSSCYQLGTMITNGSGDASHAMPLTPGAIGVFRLSRSGASGFVSGFRVP